MISDWLMINGYDAGSYGAMLPLRVSSAWFIPPLTSITASTSAAATPTMMPMSQLARGARNPARKIEPIAGASTKNWNR